MAEETSPAESQKDEKITPNSDGGVMRHPVVIGIITSLVASAIFSIFFQQILSSINELVVSSINIFYRGYIDSLYDSASANPVDESIAIIFVFSAIAPMYIIISLSIILRIGEEDTKIQMPKRTEKFALYPALLSAPVAFFMMIIMLSGTMVSLKINSIFQRQILALTPVISDQEKKDLQGMWAEMKSRSDYENIQKELKSLSTKYHRTLPHTIAVFP
jgi:hypothetical protein